MILSTKGRYGLKAMIDLAVNGQDGPVSIRSIASRQGISERYLEQLMGKLKKAGLVESVRGSQGGYSILKPPEDISAGEILIALEGDLRPVDCKELVKDGGCKTAGSCASKYVWKRIDESIEETVNCIFLKELVEISENNTRGN